MSQWGKGEAIYSADTSKDRTRVAAIGRDAIAHAKGPPRRRGLLVFLSAVTISLGTADTLSKPAPEHDLPHRSKVAKTEHHKLGSAPKTKRTEPEIGSRILLPSTQ